MSKKFKILLSISLAFNLLLVGVIFGFSIKWYKHKPEKFMFERQMNQLPHRTQQTIKKHLKELYFIKKEFKQQIRKKQKIFSEILQSESINLDLTEVVIEELSTLHQEESKVIYETIAKFASQDIPSEYRKLLPKIIRFKKPFSKHHPRHYKN